MWSVGEGDVLGGDVLGGDVLEVDVLGGGGVGMKRARETGVSQPRPEHKQHNAGLAVMSDRKNKGGAPHSQRAKGSKAGREAGDGAGRKGRRKPRIGEIGVRYGKRNFLRTDGQGLIAQDDCWHLVAVPQWDRGGWRNFKLYLDKPAKKNLFNVAVNEKGIYPRRDVDILKEYHPGRVEWVLEQAQRYMGGEIVLEREKGEIVKYGRTGWRAVKVEGAENGR